MKTILNENALKTNQLMYYIRFSAAGFNPLSTSVALILKPVNWFALQIN